MYYYESIFPKKDVHAFLAFVTHSTINSSGLAYIECKRLIRGSAEMSTPKMSTPKMSTPKMSIPEMTTVPKCLPPKMSTVPKCLFPKCLLLLLPT